MRRVKAVLECEYSEQVADAVARSLQPDNADEGGTFVRTFRRGMDLVTEIESSSLAKLLSLLDDVLRCLSICDPLIALTDEPSPSS